MYLISNVLRLNRTDAGSQPFALPFDVNGFWTSSCVPCARTRIAIDWATDWVGADGRERGGPPTDGVAIVPEGEEPVADPLGAPSPG